MSDSEIATQLVSALEATANRETGAKTALVSITIDVVTQAEAGAVETRLVRKTRTLAFLSAEFVSGDGTRVATASSVHKLLA